MDHVMALLFDKDFLVTMFVAIFAFATVVTLGVPYLERGGLEDRLKSVARRREELRARHHASLNKKASLRAEPVSYMKATLDRFKLGNVLESENTKEKLASAGYRGQAPLITFMFFRFVMPFIMFGLLSAINWQFEKLLFTEHMGRVMVYFGLALMLAGVLVIRKIIDVKV